MTPAHTSATSSGPTKTPSRWANIGLVDRPPPTQRSKPGVPSGPMTPTNDDVVDLVVRAVPRAAGDRGLELARQVREGRIADVACRRSRAAPDRRRAPSRRRRLRAGSRASPVGCRRTPRWLTGPTASSCRQIAGTSSIRIQCSWMFCRSVMSATSRPYSVEISPITASCSARSAPPSMRIRIMKYSSSSSSGSRIAVRPPGMPGAALGVQPVPAKPAAQVDRVDAGESGVLVDVDDPLADVAARRCRAWCARSGSAARGSRGPIDPVLCALACATSSPMARR